MSALISANGQCVRVAESTSRLFSFTSSNSSNTGEETRLGGDDEKAESFLVEQTGACVLVKGRVLVGEGNRGTRRFSLSLRNTPVSVMEVSGASAVALDSTLASLLGGEEAASGTFTKIVVEAKASDFGAEGKDVPIASISLEIVCSNSSGTGSASPALHPSCALGSEMILLRGCVTFAKKVKGNRQEEQAQRQVVYLDSITLLEADVSIPSSSSRSSSNNNNNNNSSNSSSKQDLVDFVQGAPLRNNSVLIARPGEVYLGSGIMAMLLSLLMAVLSLFGPSLYAFSFGNTCASSLLPFCGSYDFLWYGCFYACGSLFFSHFAFVWASLLYAKATHRAPKNKRSLFINAYNAWGFSGVVPQGQLVPMYAMPNVFVKAFHDGSPSLDINLGKHAYQGGDKGKAPRVASDMFSMLADRESRCGLVLGFLSQREQFGSVAFNTEFNHLSVVCACDGVMLGAGSAPCKTDWFCLYKVQDIDELDPLGAYMDLAGKFNNAKLQQPRYIPPPFVDVPPQAAAEAEAAAAPVALAASASNNLPLSLVGLAPLSPPSGWCSWYHFFEHVTENDLINNIEQMRNIKSNHSLHVARQGFNLFQVDDGYQRTWGDWLELDTKRFQSKTLSSIVDMVKGSQMVPGLWMAPFACDQKSLLAKEHPEWILRQGPDKNSAPCNSANCGKWFYGLDVTNPEARAYISRCISTVVKEWGFSYLKFDFLYAAALSDAQSSYHDRSLTRAQAIQIGMKLIAEAAGEDVFVLGCGAPMGSVIGHVHANRVSCDAGLSWLPGFPLPSHDKWNLPSAQGMVRNSICRMSMHGRWWINDPDCMLLRRTTSFSDDEILGIATVKAMSGGSFILSDDLAAVPNDRMRVAQQLLPASGVSAVAIDLMDKEMPELLRLQLSKDVHSSACAGLGKWTLFAACNWGTFSKENIVSLRSLQLPMQSEVEQEKEASSTSSLPPILHVFDFWNSTYSTHDLSASLAQPNALLSFPPVSPHSSRLLSLRVMKDYTLPLYLGSNLHFSCGLEVESFSVHQDNILSITFGEGAVREAEWKGFVWVYVPSSNEVVHVSGSVSVSLGTQVVSSKALKKGNVHKILVARRADASQTQADVLTITYT